VNEDGFAFSQVCNGGECKVSRGGVGQHCDGLRRIDSGIRERDGKPGICQSDGRVSAECHQGQGDNGLTYSKIGDAFAQLTDRASDLKSGHKWWGRKSWVAGSVAATEDYVDHAHCSVSHVDGDLSSRWSRIRQLNFRENIGWTKSRNRDSTHQSFPFIR
jgi:hypothetical protein